MSYQNSLLSITHHIISSYPEFIDFISETSIRSKVDDAKRRKYVAQNDLDRKLEKYIDFDGGYFVELGANDGLSQSNTFYFECFRNWTGILIEPYPHNYQLLSKTRSSQTAKFCNACVSFEYGERFVELIYSNLMTTSLGLESDIKNPTAHANDGIRFLKHETPIHFGSLAVPLNDLLVKSSAPHVIDLLSLDVEGAELEVLKGIDHSLFRFRNLLVECRDIAMIRSFLQEFNYCEKAVLSDNGDYFDVLFQEG